MRATKESERKTRMVKTAATGLLTAGFYLAAFLNASKVMEYFTAPKWYAAAAIVAVAVSLHAALAMNLWVMLRDRALHREVQRQTDRKVAVQGKRKRQNARARLYINPWHNV